MKNAVAAWQYIFDISNSSIIGISIWRHYANSVGLKNYPCVTTLSGVDDNDTLSLSSKSLLYSERLSNRYVPKCQIFISSVAPTDLNIGAGTADCTIWWSFLYQALRLAGLSESPEKYNHRIVAPCVNTQ